MIALFHARLKEREEKNMTAFIPQLRNPDYSQSGLNHCDINDVTESLSYYYI